MRLPCRLQYNFQRAGFGETAWQISTVPFFPDGGLPPDLRLRAESLRLWRTMMALEYALQLGITCASAVLLTGDNLVETRISAWPREEYCVCYRWRVCTDVYHRCLQIARTEGIRFSPLPG